MIFEAARWMGRHKGISRRLGRDLRFALPFMLIALCFVSSVTAIMAAELGGL
jgi:hypothetical protein